MTQSKSFKLGIIAFMNDGGLGIQTRRLTYMLNPYRVMVIDSTPFSKNKTQHPEWYKDYNHFIVNGFPKNHDVLEFVKDLTHVLVCENPYNFYLLKVCRELGIKTFVQTNYEFCENLNNPHLPLPDVFLMPSYWVIEDMKKRFPQCEVLHLPPPIDPADFIKTFEYNVKRKGKRRFLHVVGTFATKDRNGTLDLLAALKYSIEDYELVITSQHPLSSDRFITTDSRVRFVIGNKFSPNDIYLDNDVLVLPRRYGGLSLTVNEALMCGLPVIMPLISPNKELLPHTWLTSAQKTDVLHARADIDVYKVDPRVLARKIDLFATMDLSLIKTMAHGMALSNFSSDVLNKKYMKLFEYGTL